MKLLAGNPGKRPLNLADGVNPRVEIPTPPKQLGHEARKEWRRITPLLEELGLISGLDRAALTLYCQALGRLAELETAFNSKVQLVMEKEKLCYADAVFRCSYARAPKTGYEQQSVLVQLIRSHREEVNRYLGHFGLSPAARARVTPSNYVQPNLPGIDAPPTAQSGFAKFSNSNPA
ncbi:MAG: phage terminase small subunit P27 family [Ramlibacter sp.]